jgi:hypothetical protein
MGKTNLKISTFKLNVMAFKEREHVKGKILQ